MDKVDSQAELSWEADAQLQLARRALRVRRAQTAGLLLCSLAATLGAGIGAWRFRDVSAYCWRAPEPPLALGEAIERTPESIPHNAYVQLQGITEHRGLVQKVLQVPGWGRDERWYFRLLGSQGVFIETPPDAARFGFTTDLSVRGRSVDPAIETPYAALLHDYLGRYRAVARPHARIIQVDLAPGTHRLRALMPALLLAALSLVSLGLAHRLLRLMRSSGA